MLDIYLSLHVLNIPTELRHLILSFVCIRNMRRYIESSEINFDMLCKKLKDSNYIMAGQFTLLCMTNDCLMMNDKMMNSRKAVCEKKRNITVRKSLTIKKNTVEVPCINIYGDNKSLSFGNDRGEYKKSEMETWLELFPKKIVSINSNEMLEIEQYMDNTRDCTFTYVDHNYYDIIQFKVTTVSIDNMRNEIHPILQKIANRDRVKKIADFIDMCYDLPIHKIIFDGETINVYDWDSVIFKVIHYESINFYLPRTEKWPPIGMLDRPIYKGLKLLSKNKKYLGKFSHLYDDIMKIIDELPVHLYDQCVSTEDREQRGIRRLCYEQGSMHHDPHNIRVCNSDGLIKHMVTKSPKKEIEYDLRYYAYDDVTSSYTNRVSHADKMCIEMIAKTVYNTYEQCKKYAKKQFKFV